MPHLVVSPAAGPDEPFALRGERILVGRSHDCDLILPDVLLSRRHVEIVRSEGGWTVRDLGSLNGTRLNGVRLIREEPLRDGDRLGLSDWTLVFHEEDPPEGVATLSGGEARLRDITDLATRTDLEAGALTRQSRVLGVLTRAAAALVSTPAASPLLDTLLGHILDAVPARRGAVALFEGEPPSAVVVAAKALEGAAPTVVDVAVVARLLQGESAFLAPRVNGSDGTVCSVLCAPLWFGGPGPGVDRLAGCVALEAAAGPTPFDEEHVQLVAAVANLAASRLESLRLREESAEKRRLDEDLRGAARIQAGLLPEETPSVPGWELAGSSRLCSAVGADYYDFVVDDGRLLLALGDVAGKGLAAALLMATLRAAVRALWREDDRLSAVVHGVNDNLCETVPPNRYATLLLARLDTRGGELVWVNAGHAPALVVRSDGTHTSLEEGGTVLAAFHDAEWREGRTTLGEGDVLVLLSDGVLEAARAASSGLGPERLVEAVRGVPRGPAAAILAALQAAAEECLGGERRSDDHTFVVVRRQPSRS